MRLTPRLPPVSPLSHRFPESLSDNASAFSSRAKQLHRRMWWRDTKVGLVCLCLSLSVPLLSLVLTPRAVCSQMKMIVALVVVALLLIIISEYKDTRDTMSPLNTTHIKCLLSFSSGDPAISLERGGEGRGGEKPPPSPPSLPPSLHSPPPASRQVSAADPSRDPGRPAPQHRYHHSQPGGGGGRYLDAASGQSEGPPLPVRHVTGGGGHGNCCIEGGSYRGGGSLVWEQQNI